jgi:hypothetical protein
MTMASNLTYPRAGPGQNAYQLGPEVLQQASFVLTSAEILALNTTPLGIVRTPGAGQIVEFISATLFLNYGTTTYAANGDVVFIHGVTAGSNLVSDTIAAADLIQKTADAWRTVQALSADVAPVASPTETSQLSISIATGDPTTGDSTLRGLVTYRIVDFSNEV